MTYPNTDSMLTPGVNGLKERHDTTGLHGGRVIEGEPNTKEGVSESE